MYSSLTKKCQAAILAAFCIASPLFSDISFAASTAITTEIRTSMDNFLGAFEKKLRTFDATRAIVVAKNIETKINTLVSERFSTNDDVKEVAAYLTSGIRSIREKITAEQSTNLSSVLQDMIAALNASTDSSVASSSVSSSTSSSSNGTSTAGSAGTSESSTAGSTSISGTSTAGNSTSSSSSSNTSGTSRITGVTGNSGTSGASSATSNAGNSSSSAASAPKECTGTMPTVGEGMQANYYNGITAGPATANTTWMFSPAGGSCTVSCKSGYMRDGAKDSCIPMPTLAISVYNANGKLMSGISSPNYLEVSCYSQAHWIDFVQGNPTYTKVWSDGIARINIGQRGCTYDDSTISVSGYFDWSFVKGGGIPISTLKNDPKLSLDSGKGYTFSYSNPYLALVRITITGAWKDAKMCAGAVGSCQNTANYVTPPSPWTYSELTDTWSFAQDVDWDKAGTEYFDFGTMKDGKILKVESIHYTGYPTNNRPSAAASGYCPNGQSVAGPCTGIDIAVENNSSDGHLRLVVHTPNKSGWKGCAAGVGGCDSLSAYRQAQSPYENNSAWSWNESTKTWSCDIYWPDLPTGTYNFGVANDRYVFKTVTVNWVKP